MKSSKLYKMLFVGMGIYDFLLGLIFLFFYQSIFKKFNIPLPNHPGYILVPALFLISGAIGEFLIAKNLLRNIDLALVRLLMKISFTGALLYCYFMYDISKMFLIIGLFSITGIVINTFYMHWAKSQS